MSREINRVAPEQKKILERYLSNPPPKLGRLASELGVQIKVSSLVPGISGQIKNENGSYIIRVNRHETRERQRFTIAHEIAHFLLHKPVIDSSADGIMDTIIYSSRAPQHLEYEANRLAADIVMPLEEVRKILHNDFDGVITERTIESLAARFQVSKAAMEIRLSTMATA